VYLIAFRFIEDSLFVITFELEKVKFSPANEIRRQTSKKIFLFFCLTSFANVVTQILASSKTQNSKREISDFKSKYCHSVRFGQQKLKR
jgi:hypothetical protein